MKKTITLICFASLFFVFSAHSQISKGAVLLGGNIGFTSNDNSVSNDDDKNHSYMINPSIGFVVKENKVFGVNLSYAHSIYKTAPDQKSVSNNYGGGIFHRRYLPLGKSFYFYGQGQLNVNFGKGENVSGTNYEKTTSNSLGVSVFPGIAYALSKKFHLEIAMNNLVSLGYSSVKYHNVSIQDTRTSQLNFVVNANPASSLVLGFRILLGNK